MSALFRRGCRRCPFSARFLPAETRASSLGTGDTLTRGAPETKVLSAMFIQSSFAPDLLDSCEPAVAALVSLVFLCAGTRELFGTAAASEGALSLLGFDCAASAAGSNAGATGAGGAARCGMGERRWPAVCDLVTFKLFE